MRSGCERGKRGARSGLRDILNGVRFMMALVQCRNISIGF